MTMISEGTCANRLSVYKTRFEAGTDVATEKNMKKYEQAWVISGLEKFDLTTK